MIRPGKLPHRYWIGAALGLLAGIFSLIVLAKFLCQLPLPVVLDYPDQQVSGWLAMRLHALNPFFFPEISAKYQHYLQNVFGTDDAWRATARLDIAFLISTVFSCVVCYFVGRPLPDTKIITGRDLFEGEAAHHELSKLAEKECAISGQGLKLHPDFSWCQSLSRETTHQLVTGGTGKGKTQVLLPQILGAIQRQDKVLVFDIKGDFTSFLPAPFALIGPWDSRGYAWNIARDCLNRQDARELAAQLIQPGQDPMWHQAARQVLASVIEHLQYTKPLAWTWRDLLDKSSLPQEKLLEIVQFYAPEAANLLAGESKTTDGILINLSASLAIVADLASAWGDAKQDQRFSFSEWLIDPNPKHRVVVLQGSGRYTELMRGYVKGVISLLAGRICSPELSDDRNRRVSIFLDEFPQLGKLEKISSLVEVSRSRGIRLYFGAQDLAQIKECYGSFIGTAWGSMIGTQIICQVSPGETAQWFAKEVIGYAKIEKTVVFEGKPQPAQTMEQLVMEPSDLSDYLGPHKRGVKAALLGYGDVFLLDWPYTTLPKLREPMVPATWTLAAKPKSVTQQKSQDRETKMNDEQKKPRLVLRQPTREEIFEMAESGSDIKDLADEIDDMVAAALELADE